MHRCNALRNVSCCAGNPDLALSVYKAMSAVGRSPVGPSGAVTQPGSAAGLGRPSGWPPATLLTVRALVLGLARALRVSDAVR